MINAIKGVMRITAVLVCAGALGTAAMPGSVYADNQATLQASEPMVPTGGVVVTDSVSAPVMVGGVLYVPPGPTGGGQASSPIYLGTIETFAVTGPILVGEVLYIPASATGGGQVTAPMFLGSVQTWAVTAPIMAGDILYVP